MEEEAANQVSKHTPKRTKAQREEDLVLVADLYATKRSQQQICDALNAVRPYQLTRTAVARDIDEVRSQWRKQYTKTFNDHLAKELAVIDRTEARAWEAWDRSQKEQRETSATLDPAKEGSPDRKIQRSTVRKKERDGEARWLEIVLACVDRRAKLLGLFAPERHELFVREGSKEDGPTPDELQRLEMLLLKDARSRVTIEAEATRMPTDDNDGG